MRERAALTAPLVAPPGTGGRLRDALQGLALIARLHQVAADADHLLHALGASAGAAIDSDQILLAAAHLGLKARRVEVGIDRLAATPLPALALLRDGRVCVLARADAQRVLVQHLGDDRPPHPVLTPTAAFAEQWRDALILVASRASLAGSLAHFDVSWFIPSLVKHRRLLG